jgi:hypothetical protein
MSHIPTHRSPTEKKRGLRVAGAVSVALGTLLAFSSPAAAFDNYTQSFQSDGASTARCALTLTDANYTNLTVRANINASVQPNNFNGVFNNTHVGITCVLVDKAFGNTLKVFSLGHQGPYVSGSNISTQPLYPDYLICTYVATTLRSGATLAAGPHCEG